MNMPRLSIDLILKPHPFRCQSCGVESLFNFTRWQEHDENDKPEPIVVVLCVPCSKRLIEPHPRLYRELQRHEPFPGTLDLCIQCRHRDGTRCTSPDLLANGGNGVILTIKKPVMAHLKMAKPARSGWHKMWTESASDCKQREVS